MASPASSRHDAPAASSLPRQLWHLYRLALAALLLLWQALDPPSADPDFLPVTAAYLAFALVLLALRPGRRSLLAPALIDILLISLLIHVRANLTLGLLLAPTIIAASLSGRDSLSLIINGLALLAISINTILLATFENTLINAMLTAAALAAIERLSRQLRPRSIPSFSQAQPDPEYLQRERLNAQIFQHLDTGVLICRHDGQIRFVNAACQRLLGGSHRLPEALLSTMRRWLENGGPAAAELSLDGRHQLRARFTRLDDGILILLEDRSQFHQQAQQSKLTALGRLTASIAHEIRNPLGAISHASQLLEESTALEPADRRLSQIINEQAARMNRIIENIIQLSRRRQAEPENLPLQTWLKQFAHEFTQLRELPSDAIHLDLAPEPLQATMDPSHLQQVLTNLLDNTLSHGWPSRQPPACTLSARLSPQGDAIWLELSDRGPGIAPEIAEQIFEPFFTTRANGTGLGLYIAQQLCELNGVSLSYLSNPGGGSRFRLSFGNPRAC